MALKRMCRCGKLIPVDDKYCEVCSEALSKDKSNNNRTYDKYYRNKESSEVYHSKEWRKVRRSAFNRDNKVCLYCLYKKNFGYAELPHHIIEVEEDKSKAYDLDNLVSVCGDCHSEIHAIYRKGSTYKENLQNTLRSLIIKKAF